MGQKMTDVTMHIDEDTTHEQREALRNHLLQQSGVMAAKYNDDTPHLMLIEYDPESVDTSAFLDVANSSGFHAELIGL
jgi:hypothetical protein